jgi:hypothetical protein
MAMMKAFFDETGTHDGSDITGIGGFVGTAEAWEKLEPKWLEVLAEFADKGVSWFHMSEAVAQRGQFDRIEKPTLSYLIAGLSKSLGEFPLTPFFSAVVSDDWGVVKDAEFSKRFPRPIDLCFENLVRHLWLWARAYAGGEAVVPVFAYSQDLSAGMAAIWHAYGAHDWFRNILGPIAFGHPQQIIPLQAADLLAHQMNWDAGKRFQPFSLQTAGPTKALYWATRGEFVRGNYFDGKSLLLVAERYKEAGYPSGPVNLF